MKKVLRFIGVLLLILVVGVLILGLVAPKEMAVTRTELINAPKSVVAAQMLHYKNFNNWSPWSELDPNMKTEVVGEDGAAGAKYTWSGNDKVGKGEMLAKSVSDDELQYSLKFMEPWESTAEGSWKVEDAGNNKTNATWNFTTHVGFPMNGLMMLMNMRKHLGMDFRKGLRKLKAYSEAHANEAPASAYKIEDLQFPGHTYATIRKTMKTDMAEMEKFFGENIPAIGKSAGKRIIGPASALVYKWDEAAGSTDMAAAFPISGAEPIAGTTLVTVPPSKGYVLVYKGGYAGLGGAHQAIGTHLAAKGGKQGMVIEEYIKGMQDEKDSTKWETNIIYLIQ